MRRLIACCLSTGADGVQVLAGDSAMVTLIPQRLGRTVRFAQHQEVYTVWIGPYRLKIVVRIHNAVKTVSVGKTGTLCEDGWLGGLYHTSGGNPGGGWPSAPTPAFFIGRIQLPTRVNIPPGPPAPPPGGPVCRRPCA